VTGALASTLTNATSDLTPAPSETGRREHEIEIDTDLAEGHSPRAQMITQTVVTNGTSVTAREMTALDMAAPDDDAIQVSDDEIESAEPARPTLTSGLPAFGGTVAGDGLSRSRPPSRPSLRPGAASTSLPPPRRSSRAGALLGSSLPPPSFPSMYPPEHRSGSLSRSERDPWLLANKTLELSRATARISALEDQVAFRDARIMTLEERLEAAQLKIEELERKRDALPVVAGANAPASGSTGANAPPASSLAPSTASARGASKPAIAIPKPADVAKALEAKPAPARAAQGTPAQGTPAHGILATKLEDASDSLTPEAPEQAGQSKASASIPPEADEAQTNGAAAPPSGPEDVGRIADIGTRFEAALRRQGITRISQIAAWSDADVRQVAKALKIPKSRIVKGRWIEAAREMIGSRSTSE